MEDEPSDEVPWLDTDERSAANGSLSRLSHVSRRLEKRGYLRRSPLSQDGRVTVALLTDQGLQALRAAAPGHVRQVRPTVLDPLTRADRLRLRDIGLRVIEALDPQAATAVRRASGREDD